MFRDIAELISISIFVAVVLMWAALVPGLHVLTLP